MARLVLAVLGIAAPAAAQSTYDVRREDGGFEDLRPLGTALPFTADGSGFNAPIGFSFPYFGTSHTTIGITSEGYLTVAGGATNTPGALPSTTPPNGVIAPLWANLDLTKNRASARIDMRTLGSAPSRRLVVQWSDMPLASDPASRLTFQVALFEGTGAIEFRYSTLRNGDGSTGGPASGSTATIGIEDQVGVEGLLVARNVAGAVAAGDRLLIEREPVTVPELSIRSAVARPGTAVVIPIDINGKVGGLRGFQGVLEAVPEQAGLPELAVRAMVRGELAAVGSAAYVSGVDLAATGAIPLVLPVDVTDDDSVPDQDGARNVGELTFVVPPDAMPGTTYRLELTSVSAASRTGGLLPVTVRAGRLAIGDATATVDRIDLVVAPRLAAGGSTPVEVIASGAGTPVPGVAVSLFVDNGLAVTLASATGVTDAEGRFRTTLSSLAPGFARLLASSPGLDEAEARITIFDGTPPRITSSPPTEVVVASLYGYDVVSSPAGQAFDLEVAPAGMTITAAGQLRWVPTAEQVGLHAVTVRITDTPTRQSFPVLVLAAPVIPRPNTSPRITSTAPPLNLLVGETYMYDVEATDPDGDLLAFSLGSGTAGVAIVSTSGLLTWTPGPADVGVRTALVLVADGYGGLHGQRLQFLVTVPPEDLPPVIISSPTLEAPIGEPYTYQVVAQDPEEQPVTYRLVSGPLDMGIDPSTGVIFWTPHEDDYATLPAQVHISGETLTTLGGDVCQLVHGRFEDPPGLVYGTVLPQSLTGPWGIGWTPDPTTFAMHLGPGPAATGGPGQGHGEQRDYHFVYKFGFGSIEGVQGTPPEAGVFFDLHGPSNKVVVFPVTDHGPLPGESLELSVYLSNDLIEWTRARLEVAYEGGWDPDPAHIADALVGVYSMPDSRTFRYCSLGSGGPSSLWADGDFEADAVAGLTAEGVGVGAPSASTVIVEAVDAAGNVTRQTFTLAVPGESHPVACDRSIDFGEVRIGDTARQHVLIDSVGTQPLTVVSAKVSGPSAPFDASLTQDSGEVVAEVTFSPSTIGPVTTVVIVSSSGGLETITVTGTGVDPSTTPPSPGFTSTPPALAVLDRELVYLARATDPAGLGLAFAMESGPPGMTIHPISGALRWTPAASDVGTRDVVITATDAEGQVGRQSWCIVSVELTLEATVTPLEAPPGTNDFAVDLRPHVSPARRVATTSSPAKRLVLEHVLPANVVLLPGSLTLPCSDVTALPDGSTVLRWLLPLTTVSLRFDVRATDMPVGVHSVSLATRARILLGDETGPPPSALLRTMPNGGTNVVGLSVDLATGDLLATDATLDRMTRLDRLSGAVLAVVPLGPAAHDVELAPMSANAQTVDPETDRMSEVVRGTGVIVRTTRTDGFDTDLRGIARDPLTGRLYLVGEASEHLYRHDRRFGAHLPAPSGQPTDVTFDPSTGEVVALEATNRTFYRLDAATHQVRSSHFLPQVSDPQGVAVDPARGEVHVVGPAADRVFTYSAGGTFLRSTRTTSFTSGAVGLDRNPTTGEWLFADNARDRVVRVSRGFGLHIPAPGVNTAGLSYDPTTNRLVACDPDNRVVSVVDAATGGVVSTFYTGFQTLFPMDRSCSRS